MALQPFDLQVRHFIYRHFVETARPPSVAETAQALHVDADQIAGAYQRLHQHHALFLEPGTLDVRMANPLSAVPTPFRVQTDRNTYWANCAWDLLGIAAMLQCDATLETQCADCGEALNLRVVNGRVIGQTEVAHFPLPFRRWYDDLILT